MEELKKELVQDAKAKGLDIAEDSLKSLVEFAFDALPKIAAKTETKLDDMFVPVLALIKPTVMKLVDKLDGKAG